MQNRVKFIEFFNADKFNLANINIIFGPLAVPNPMQTGAIEILARLKNKKYPMPDETICHPLSQPLEIKKYSEISLPISPVTVENIDCLKATANLKTQNKNAKIALLNMANRKHVGGGVYQGARAQEECIFCGTNISGTLLQYAHKNKGYVSSNNRPSYKNSFGQTDVLYSKNIWLLRETNQLHEWIDLNIDKQIEFNLISSAALQYDTLRNRYFEYASTGKFVFSDSAAKAILTAQLYNQIKVAIEQSNTHLILGAFGCGAFNNDPQFIAKTYRKILSLPDFIGKIKTPFAVLAKNDNPKDIANFNTFQSEFSTPLKPLSEDEQKKLITQINDGISYANQCKRQENSKDVIPSPSVSNTTSSSSSLSSSSATLFSSSSSSATAPQKDNEDIQFILYTSKTWVDILKKFIESEYQQLNKIQKNALKNPKEPDYQKLEDEDFRRLGAKSSLYSYLKARFSNENTIEDAIKLIKTLAFTSYQQITENNNSPSDSWLRYQNVIRPMIANPDLYPMPLKIQKMLRFTLTLVMQPYDMIRLRNFIPDIQELENVWDKKDLKPTSTPSKK